MRAAGRAVAEVAVETVARVVVADAGDREAVDPVGTRTAHEQVVAALTLENVVAGLRRPVRRRPRRRAACRRLRRRAGGRCPRRPRSHPRRPDRRADPSPAPPWISSSPLPPQISSSPSSPDSMSLNVGALDEVLARTAADDRGRAARVELVVADAAVEFDRRSARPSSMTMMSLPLPPSPKMRSTFGWNLVGSLGSGDGPSGP